MKKGSTKSEKVKFAFFAISIFFASIYMSKFLVSNGIISQSNPERSERKARYTMSGERIQANGLTVDQEVKIKMHCAEKPQAWDCR